MSTPTKRTPWPASSREACWSPACSERQGPHHEAQKFSTSTWPPMLARSSLEPSRVSPANAGSDWRSEAGTIVTFGWTGRTCPVAASGASALPPPPPSAVSATTATTAIRTTPPATRASIRRDIGTSIGTGRTAASAPAAGRGALPPPPPTTPSARSRVYRGGREKGSEAPESVTPPLRESCPSQSTAGGCKGVAASTDERESALGLADARHHGDLPRDDHLPRGDPLVVALLRRRDAEVDRQLHPFARGPQDRPLQAGDPGPARGGLVRGHAGGRRAADQEVQPAEPEGAGARRRQAGGDWWLQVAGGRGSTGESQQAQHARRLHADNGRPELAPGTDQAAQAHRAVPRTVHPVPRVRGRVPVGLHLHAGPGHREGRREPPGGHHPGADFARPVRDRRQ